MPPSVMQLAGVPIRARSVGGIETCIELPSFNLCFDIGRCPHTAVNLSRVFLTHAHMDHAAGLAWHAATRDLLGMGSPTYYVPAENLNDFEDLFKVWRRLDHSELSVRFQAVQPGDVITLSKNRKVVAFRAIHRVPTLGYAVLQSKQKIRPEFRELSGEEIHKKRLTGEVVSDPIEEIEVAFTGDTTIEILEREELIRKAKLLVMEVTFLDDKAGVARARKSGHIHLDEVVERQELFLNQHILFTHFSKRYSPDEIREIFARRLPTSFMERVSLLLPDPTRLPG